jgi:hypothetical protein
MCCGEALKKLLFGFHTIWYMCGSSYGEMRPKDTSTERGTTSPGVLISCLLKYMAGRLTMSIFNPTVPGLLSISAAPK